MEGHALKTGSCHDNNIAFNSERKGSISFHSAFILTYIPKHRGASFRPGGLSSASARCRPLCVLMSHLFLIPTLAGGIQ